MSGWIRFFIGFLLGLLLTGAGFALAGIGHGTYAAMLCTTGIIGLLFLPFTLFLAPFQWGLYLVLIPPIASSKWRTFWIAIIIIAHLVPGTWLAATDPAFSRALNQDVATILVYVALLLLTIAVLVFLGLRGLPTKN